MTYKDWTFNSGNYGDMDSYKDANAIVLAIKNIILAKPGNFPLTPGLGINIEKYQFDLLDDQTLNNIKQELNYQITKYVQSLENVDIFVHKIPNEETGETYIGISISNNSSENGLTANFLILREEEEIKIYNEIF